jgi:hypothetical protein
MPWCGRRTRVVAVLRHLDLELTTPMISTSRAADAPARLAGRARLLARSSAILPVVAVVAAIVIPAATLAVAGSTLGYDFRAYYAAAARVLAGAPAYDPSIAYAGPYGLFLYPPTFLPLIAPFALLEVTTATWLWTALLVAATALAIARMPVSARTRWWVLLLAAQSWPTVYALKLGQVGPLLVLLFVEGWRAVERSARSPIGAGAHRDGMTTGAAALGVAGALGAAIKLQPGLVLAWALATRRLGAVAAGVATLAVLGLAATWLAGPGVWPDFITVITRVTDAVGTPHNFTPGAVALGLGASRDAAGLIQTGSMAVVIGIAGWSAWRLPAVASYLVVLVATQLLSPVLWDHYAIVLLVPVAWLLDRGVRWAAAIPLATSVLAVGSIPPAIYPVVFALAIGMLLVTGRRQVLAG